MPQAATGSIRTRDTRRGRTYHLRLRTGGKRMSVMLGCEADGFTSEDAHRIAEALTMTPRVTFVPRTADSSDPWLESAQALADTGRFLATLGRLTEAQIAAMTSRYGEPLPYLVELESTLDALRTSAHGELTQILTKSVQTPSEEKP